MKYLPYKIISANENEMIGLEYYHIAALNKLMKLDTEHEMLLTVKNKGT